MERPPAFPIVYARDVERSARFYAEQLGFEEDYRLPPDGEPGYVGLHRGSGRLGIVTTAAPEQQLGMQVGDAPRFELFVLVDDVDASVERLRSAGAAILREPEDMPWGERLAYAADPDGNPVALAAPVAVAPAAGAPG
jgi:lactoylglutathione lyase